mmetsp:Transcript_38676/g.28546  ORF Transcript_38676/g.28546 Transcript_38676/m.28546 type:complete len:172 (-) Transcript_38676:1373-1888(-)|eukprot:CAMPEP_0202979982 /NCGR_PEP_ID=MMETSP1396-20130829/85982_1 /ASSEMBLY_ACC=CAM_ASM_000872 /TAXON_ID= /ORGANISM="Pseudokeronopsis sp., Strain Brazil" /LENGTH=171 /DNA_ID=CAMNT_0049719657 /DNA_START=1249 /DNA_END=1764 /DNA_ORIENTATION=-
MKLYEENSDVAFNKKGEYKMSGENALQLIGRAKSGDFKSELCQIKTLYSYLNLFEGQEELFSSMDLMLNLDHDPLPPSLRVLHCAALPLDFKSRALKLKKATGMAMLNTQFAKKEDRLAEAAKLFLRNGMVREFCETMMVLEQYEKALAFAPIVSIEYWQELAERHAHILA